MAEGKQDKIGKFKVGDLVSLRHKVVICPPKNKILGAGEKFYPPTMVASEVFIDEKAAKSTFIGAGETSKKVKDIGSCIKVKCQWFYEGRCQEKIFWEHVLELVE